MPPEFIPSERRKKKQNPKPKEPRSVDDIVDDILRNYCDQQRELGDVDNWGQPNKKLDRKKVEKWVRKNLPKLNDNEKKIKNRGKKKFSLNAPTESLSEAIGNKLKGKADTQKNKEKKSKTPKTSEPRKSKPSPKESRSPKSQSPSKKEHKEHLGPKIKTKPSEARRKKIRFPKAPTEGLSKVIGDKLKEKAEQLKDRKMTPTISKPRKSTQSLKEKRSPKLKSPAKKEQKKQLGPKVKLPPMEVRRKKSKEKIERKSDRQKKPTSTDSKKTKPAAREKNTPQMKNPSNKESKERLGPKLKMKPPELRREKIDTKNLKENPERLKDHKVRMFRPAMRGVEIKTEADLKKYINKELSGMKHLPSYDKMMNDAVAHINLRQLIGERKSLSFPEIRELSNQTDTPLRTTRKWVIDSGKPKMYRFAESAITKSEARSILEKLRLSRKGVDNVLDIDRRLTTLYTGDYVRQLKSYNRDLNASGKYFKFLKLLSEGGIVTDIARRAGVSSLTGRNYTNGIFPYLVKRVVDVPSTIPKDGWKWLQLKTNDSPRIIEVPIKVTDWSDVQHVLQQLHPFGDKMAQLASQFDIHDKETAFMYVLGAIISDGSLSTSGPSSRMTLPLSKKYDWSPQFGEAVCCCMETLGIQAEKKSDWKSPDNIILDKGKERRISGPGFHVWGSEQHPLLRWVRDSCLGLTLSQTKIENPIDAEWVLSAPRKLRIALVQGIADGDGYVSVNSQYAALSTKVNQPFFGRLLRSFDIESLETQKDVLVKQTDSILRFAKLKPFKQATSRCESLEELNTLVIARKSKAVGSRLSQAEINHALMLRQKGKSYGEITKLVYREFGTSWDISTIEHAIKRQFQVKSNL